MKITLTIDDTEVAVLEQESQPPPKPEVLIRSITIAEAYDSYGWVGLYVDGKFAWEGSTDDLADALRKLGVVKTITVDNDYANWKNFPTLEGDLNGLPSE